MAFDFQRIPNSGAKNSVVKFILLPVALCLWLACPVSAQADKTPAAAPASVSAQADTTAQQAPAVVAVASAETSVQAAPAAPQTALEALEASAIDNHPWWYWPLALLFFCFILGVIAVMAGVGGGVLFVPLVSGFFPFHLDFVRGAGLWWPLRARLLPAPVFCAVTLQICVWPCLWR